MIQLRLTGGRKLRSPAGQGTRPTTSLVREAVMNLLSSKLEGCNWLDLFSGSGVMGCEALQRGARNVVAIEQNSNACQIIKENLLTTGKGLSHKHNVRVFKNEVLRWLRNDLNKISIPKQIEEIPKEFDLVYIDPPYNSDIYLKVLEALLLGNWLRQDSIVICEHSKGLAMEIPSLWQEKDRRLYGSTSIRLISPQESCFYDIDSMHLQRGPTK